MKDPEVIWLQPWCEDCPINMGGSLRWREEGACSEGCSECQRQPVKYVKAER